MADTTSLFLGLEQTTVSSQISPQHGTFIMKNSPTDNGKGGSALPAKYEDQYHHLPGTPITFINVQLDGNQVPIVINMLGNQVPEQQLYS